jgi:hypothetical protein
MHHGRLIFTAAATFTIGSATGMFPCGAVSAMVGLFPWDARRIEVVKIDTILTQYNSLQALVLLR